LAFLWSTTNAANMATIAAEFQQQVAVGFKGNPSRGRQDVNPTLRFAHHVAKGTPMDLNGAGGIPALGSLARPAAFKDVSGRPCCLAPRSVRVSACPGVTSVRPGSLS